MNRVFNFFIKNVRAGFATNSSSTHSLVFYSFPVEGKIPNRPEEGYEFGWNNFSISKKIDKLIYGIITQISVPWGVEGDEAAEQKQEELARIKPLLPESITDEEYEEVRSVILEENYPYVDHQSHPGRLEDEKLTEYLEIITQDNVAIYGGSDNYDTTPRVRLLDEGVEAVRMADNPLRNMTFDFYISYDHQKNEDTEPFRPISEKLDDILRIKFDRELDEIVQVKHFIGRYPDSVTKEYTYDQWKNFPETEDTFKTIKELKEHL